MRRFLLCGIYEWVALGEGGGGSKYIPSRDIHSHGHLREESNHQAAMQPIIESFAHQHPLKVFPHLVLVSCLFVDY